MMTYGPMKNISVNYYGVDPEQHGEYFIGVERLRDIIFEYRALNEEEAALTESAWLGFPVKIDYAQYLRWEEEFQLLIITVRHKSELVGNLIYFLKPQVNMGNVLGAMDNGIYIKPEHRKGRLAFRLMKFGEKVLRRIGVRFITHGDKGPAGLQDLSRFFSKLGYRPVSTVFVKELSPETKDEISQDQN